MHRKMMEEKEGRIKFGLAGSNATAPLVIGGAIVRLENVSHKASLLGVAAHLGP